MNKLVLVKNAAILNQNLQNKSCLIYNQSQFYLKIADSDFAVGYFTSDNYGLSEDYKFTLQINSDKLLSAAELISKKSQLIFDNKTEIHGTITDLKYISPTPDGKQHQYTAIMHSPLHHLKHKKSNKSLAQKNITDIIELILGKNIAQLELSNNYPAQELLIQKHQTDYDFLLQQLNHFGLFFTFDKDQLIITDDINKLANWQNNKGSLTESVGSIVH